MPLTKAGQDVMASMKKQYGDKKGESVFYASHNAGIPGAEKWEHNPGPEAPIGEHIAGIHAHMQNIGDSMNAIADKVNMLKAIRERQRRAVEATPRLSPTIHVKI